MKPTPTPEMIEAALRGWHDAIINAPAEDVEDRRRRCIGAALSAALSVQPAAAVVGEPVEWQRFVDGFGWQRVNDEDVQHYRDKGVSLRPLYAAPSAPDGWQPIETAPKDGTKILAWSGFWDKHHLVRWNQGENAWCEGSWCFGSVPDMVWMPLPAPPAAGDKP